MLKFILFVMFLIPVWFFNNMFCMVHNMLFLISFMLILFNIYSNYILVIFTYYLFFSMWYNVLCINFIKSLNLCININSKSKN